jgi:hypothetical protein
MSRLSSLAVAVLGAATLALASCSDSAGPVTATAIDADPARARALLRFRARDLLASAFFDSVDPSGCIVTSASITGSETVTHQIFMGEQIKSKGPGVGMFATQINFCTGEVLFDILAGTGTGVTFEAASNLTEATLSATFSDVNFATGEEVLISVTMTWVGTGAISKTRTKGGSKEEGVTFQFKGTSRDATASGTLLVDGVNLTPGPASSAQIANTSDHTVIFDLSRGSK